MTIEEKEKLYSAIDTISEYCKGRPCEECEFWILSAKWAVPCLFGGNPNWWGQMLTELEHARIKAEGGNKE